MARFSYGTVVASTTPATNWSKFVVHPFADRVLWVLANFLPVHPNAVTGVSGLLGLGAAVAFLDGTPGGLRLGAVLFYLSFALDTIDGALARLTNQRSALGAWLDTMGDFLRSMLLAPALAVGASRLYGGEPRPLYWGFAVMGVGLWYYYLAEVSQKLTGERPAQMAALSGPLARLQRLGLVPSPFGLADYEGVYLVIGPLLGRPVEGMVVAVALGALTRFAAAVVVLRRLLQMAKPGGR